MTSIERARRFIQARGKAIALTIVPLAAIAIAASQPARAATVLVFNSGGCNVTSTGVLAEPVSECYATPIPGFQNNANGVKLTGSGNVSVVSGGFGSVTFEISGTANGGVPGPLGVLPVSWDFTVAQLQGEQNLPAASQSGSLSYSLNYSLNSGSFSRTESGSLSFDDSSCFIAACSHIMGTDTIGVDGPVFGYDISLTIQGTFSQGSVLFLSIPGNSVDLNPTAGTPEPASMALGLSGLLGIAFAGFRRGRKV
jgi:hypothetical protein